MDDLVENDYVELQKNLTDWVHKFINDIMSQVVLLIDPSYLGALIYFNKILIYIIRYKNYQKFKSNETDAFNV